LQSALENNLIEKR